jgi:AcrR family transcriptional regulator
VDSATPHRRAVAAPQRIVEAALRSFADHGVAGSSLRAIAAAAGVSLGVVQHHFGTKERLRAQVDAHALRVVRAAIEAEPWPDPPADTLAEIGHRVTSILRTHPEILRYLGRAVIDGDRIALTVMDQMIALCDAQWDQFAAHGLLRPGVDRTWASLHSVVLIFGTVLMRAPLERHLPEPLTARAQLNRWDDAMTALLRHGLFRPPPAES